MALKFQFNKTALGQLKKELKVRVKALPTLKAKETALRLEVKKAKGELQLAQEQFGGHLAKVQSLGKLWDEFPLDLVQVANIAKNFRKVAGVKIPSLESVSFQLTQSNCWGLPAWISTGVALWKKAMELQIAIDIAQEKLTILEYARKKTTQKVNLYEKVQIPEYQEALLKIKRFLEDQDNLEKSSQKILKTKMSLAEVS